MTVSAGAAAERVCVRPAHGGIGVTTCDAFLQIAGDQISYTGFYDLAAERCPWSAEPAPTSAGQSR